MYEQVFTKMIAWILITSIYVLGMTRASRYTDLNHGTLLQRNIITKAPVRETALYTTLSPPAAIKPRKLSVYDTIRAVAAADKRINGQNWYHQAIVSPALQDPRQVFPTRETKRYTVQNNPKRISQESTSQFKQNNARPTSSTHISNGQETRTNQNERSTARVGAISNLNSGNRARARSRTSMARRSHSVGDSGLHEEAGMYDSTSSRNYPPSTGHFDVYEGGAIALYAVDHGHDTTSNTHIDRASDVLEANAPKQSRFKVLPNGSIVAYGVSTREYNKNRRMTQAQPTKSTFRAADQSSMPYTGKQTRPTVATQRVSSTHYQAPASVKQRRLSHGMSTTNQISVPGSSFQVSPTRNSIKAVHEKPRHGNFQGGGVPVYDDSLSVVLDDQRLRQDDRYNAMPGRAPERGVLDYFPAETTKMSHRQTSTARRTTARLLPTTTTTKPTTTTKATTTTTTTTPTTTTPKPKPKDDYWTKQGGVPINITIVNDNHVCPKSRARWQDYTVYLETKPRLCMIQITFNARYKREPIYHNTWWGNNVEWIYRTVYDPEVRMVDLHGWQGSTWYG